MRALGDLGHGFSHTRGNRTTSNASADNALCRLTGKDRFNTGCRRQATQRRAGQDHVKVLTAVRLCKLGTRLNLLRAHAGFSQSLFDALVDLTFDSAGAHASTNASTDRTRTGNTSAKQGCTQTTHDRGSSSAQALSQQVDRSGSKSFEASLDLLENALVLSVLHDAGNLLLVLFGLCRQQATEVIFDALDGVRDGVVGTERISHHTHTHGCATGNAHRHVSRLPQDAFFRRRSCFRGLRELRHNRTGYVCIACPRRALDLIGLSVGGGDAVRGHSALSLQPLLYPIHSNLAHRPQRVSRQPFLFWPE